MSTTPAPTPTQTAKKSGPPSQSFEAGGFKDWGATAKKPVFQSKFAKDDKKTIEDLKINDPKLKYRFRLVGKPYLFYRHYDFIIATSPGFENDAAWQAGHKPRERYAILCLDRNDGNKLKCLEAGPAVFKYFREYFELTQKDPGGQLTGPDWCVVVTIPTDKSPKTGTGFQNKRRTDYAVVRDETTPLTPEELKYIKDNWVELKDIKTPSDPELIKEMVAYANTKSEKDPIPGSKDWWAERRAKRDAARTGAPSASSSAPVASAEPDETTHVSETPAGDSGAGYASLFDQPEGEGSVKF